MKKISLLFIAIALLVLPVSAVDLTDSDGWSICNANSFTGETVADDFVYISGGSPNNIEIGSYDGNSYTIGLGNNTLNNPISVFCSSEGYIYFSSSAGTYRMTGTGFTSPKDLGLSGNYIKYTADPEVYGWCEDQDYIYFYVEGSDIIKRINKDTGLASTEVVYSDSQLWQGADYAYTELEKVGDDFYFLMTGGYRSINLVKNENDYSASTSTTPLISSSWCGSSAGGRTIGFLEFINDTHFYIGGSARTDSCPGGTNPTVKIYEDTGTGYTLVEDVGVNFAITTTNKQTFCGGGAALGQNNPILAYMNGRNIAFIEIFDVARTVSSSDSSSSSSSDNPLFVDLDGDGEFTQDDAKEFSLTVGPLMWIFMFLIFVMVAMSQRS